MSPILKALIQLLSWRQPHLALQAASRLDAWRDAGLPGTRDRRDDVDSTGDIDRSPDAVEPWLDAAKVLGVHP